MSDSFAHLHVHSEYSMLDGAARVGQLLDAVAADNQPAVAITDHGNMYGTLDFYKEARARNINPIIGLEAYMAANSRTERPPRRGRMDDTGGDTGETGEKLYYHLILLAETTQGYKNLMKLNSAAYLEGYYYKPRCLPAGTEIVTRLGVKPIESVEIGDEVMTHRGRFRPVKQTMARQTSEQLYGFKLSSRYQRTVWMTGEHPVLIRNREGDREWIEAKNLVTGRPSKSENARNWNSWVCLPKISELPSVKEIFVEDYVSWSVSADRSGSFTRVSPRKQIGPTNHYSAFKSSIPLDYDFGYFLGLYVAEGSADQNSVCWTLHRDELTLEKAISKFCEHLTGRPTTRSGRESRPEYKGVDIRSFSTVLAELVAALCGKGAKNKHFPSFVFDAPAEFQKGLIEGVFDGDGASHDFGTIFTQTSENLAWQVRVLQAKLSDNFSCVSRRELASGTHNDQFVSFYGPSGDDIRNRGSFADDDYVYRPVAEVVVKPFEGMVYNIEVEEDHSYVSDFAIHNCDWDILDRYHEGLIATSGCLGGLVLQALLSGDYEAALKIAGRLQDIFGQNSFFIELQDHGLPEQIKTNPQLVEIAKHLQAPLIATNDSHYVSREDHESHDALLCVQTNATVDDPKRFKFNSDQHYLKSAYEMRQLFSEYPEACDNTLAIAERCNVEIEFGKPKLPEFPLPVDIKTEADYLRQLTYEGAHERYGTTLPAEVNERLEFELDVVNSMGFSAYFLVVWDLIRFARERNIRVGPGRGSAAGSCVSYCLRITNIDPIKYDLLFERFLNPGRKQMPDIDMDFDERYRSEMIRYASEKYGWDHVAQIVTFSTIKARAAVRDAARVLGYPYAVGDKVAKAMPPLVLGRDTPLWACLTKDDKYADGYAAAADLREMYNVDADVKRVVDVAKGLEGLRRQDGIHAAAVVITNDPLTEYLPIQRKPDPGGDVSASPIVTQYEMHGVEELGLLKMDFLGLRNLSVIERALDLIERSTGTRPDIDDIPLDDAKTYAMLSRAESIGVFQLEGGPMRSLMRSLKPTEFDDVCALVALYRPGPMAANMHNDYADRKNGRQAIGYLHADAEPILKDTYGLMIYQEELMRVAQKFAGYSLEEADNLRKACGKKIRELIAKEREKFVAGCVKTGYDERLGVKIFDIIEPFADYAFNKSHSYGYGLVAYQTAWLKANYPVEYLAAILTSVKDDKDRTAVYLAECRNIDIEVLVPDVNVSESDFIARGRTIPFGMSAIRNVGGGLVDKIVNERVANGPFRDFYDFCERVDLSVLNKRTVESLIKAGAFDSLGHPRQGLCMVSESIIDRVVERRREHDLGVMTLFGGGDGGDGPSFDDLRLDIPDMEFDKMSRLSYEKDMLGLYVSDHPLMGAEHALRRHTEVSISEFREGREGDLKVVGGVVTNVSRRHTKRGDLMATFTLEDLQSTMDVWVFPKTMQEYGPMLDNDAIVTVKGRLDMRDEQPKIVAMEVRRPEIVIDAAPALHVQLPLNNMTDSLVNQLKAMLVEHPGDSPVHLHIGTKEIRLPEAFNVNQRNGFVAELRVLLGPTCIVG